MVVFVRQGTECRGITRLPLDSVMLLISELLPKVQELQASRHKTNLTKAILDFLGAVTLKHVLPPPPPLAPRRFLVSLPFLNVCEVIKPIICSGQTRRLYG